ncbi:MAG: class I adenylate-forming enzyme family protein, partial [Paracoccaceae bacterium]|nr:class I adenylate-forming enzyme family protein [Paracoccaceae bacterium]
MSSSKTQPPGGTVRTWLDERAQSGGTAIVFPETGDRLTWADLRAAAKVVASDLTTRGLSKGESVAILQPNGREGVIAFYGCLYGGFRATMLNLAAGPDAISYCLEHSEAKIAFVHASQTELFEKVAPEGAQVVPVANEAAEIELLPLKPEDHALLMYTSGTT